MWIRRIAVSSAPFRKAVILAASAIVLTASHAAIAAEKRDLGGVSPALARLKQATSGLQLNDPAELGTVTHQALGLEAGTTLELERSSKLPNGKEVSRFEQTFRGIPIWGERVIVTRNKDGTVDKLGGKAIYDVGAGFTDIMPAVTSDQALEKAKHAASGLKGGGALKSFTDTNIRQVVYVEDSGATHLAYEVSFLALASGPQAGPTRPFVLIDARTGDTLLAWDGLAYDGRGTGPGGNKKTGRYDYGNGKYPFLDITSDGKKCSLKGANVFTEDMGNKEEGSGEPFTFPCFRNTSREMNGAFSALNDAHFLGTRIFEMFKEWYGVPPLPFPLHMRVHYGESFFNAFWDGKRMTFGDGNDKVYPFVVPDVAAHEVAHGFTQEHSGLIYLGQAGGINEAFSDMAGQAFKYFLAQKYGKIFGSGTPDYMMGADMYKAPSGWMRDMCNPERDGYSIGHVKDYHAKIDTHFSSGVFNKAYCTLAKTQGWDPKRAFDVFFVANQNLWTPNASFATAAQQALEAAEALEYDGRAVVAAFEAVGINLAGGAPPPVASAPTSPLAKRALTLVAACSYFGDALPKQVAAFKSNDDAINIIQRIVDASGLARNFEILAAPVPNAAADTQDGIRYILYNPSFISDVAKLTQTKWAAISILAHEAGHHLNGHTLTPGGSRPNLEIEADKFSGFIVQRLGGSLEDARAAMEKLGSATGSATHPAKKDRLISISAGWRQACDKDPDCPKESEPAEDHDADVSSQSTPESGDAGDEGPSERAKRSVIHQ